MYWLNYIETNIIFVFPTTSSYFWVKQGDFKLKKKKKKQVKLAVTDESLQSLLVYFPVNERVITGQQILLRLLGFPIFAFNNFENELTQTVSQQVIKNNY